MTPDPRRPRPSGPYALVLALFALVLACGGKGARTGAASPPPSPTDYEAVRVFDGLSEPVDFQAPPGDTSRVFIVEKTGRIRVAKNGVLLPRPFLDLSASVSNGGEQGLLGLAFHPQFASNGRFFVNYTDHAGDTRVVGFTASGNPDSANPAGTEVLFVDQPYANHNGGQLAFGPDGFLYVGLGDGGSGGDPFGNGQSLGTLLGKMLRLDVDGAAPYAVPPGNPFVAHAGAKPEIWAYGLRNPWRYSFDRTTGGLWIADVGQGDWEEVNFEPAGVGGRNYGWNRTEGSRCYPPGSMCDTTGITMPVVEYSHNAGCSVTGGYVYRGTDLPELAGTYFYGDFCSGMIRSVRPVSGTIEERDWSTVLRRASGDAMRTLSSFGLDGRGELYLVLLDGEIYRLQHKS